MVERNVTRDLRNYKRKYLIDRLDEAESTREGGLARLANFDNPDALAMRQKVSLACISLSHNFRAQSLGGGDSGMKT